jgi:DNA-binding Lrp family transcriptional regulator
MTMGAVQGGNVISHSCVGMVTVPRISLCANPAERRTRAIAKNLHLGNFLSFPRKIRAQPKEKAMKADLDAIDWKILAELQSDGRMTNVELSRRVGISAPPCLRRVKRLEDAGVIRGYRALLNTQDLGLHVVAFCLVGLNHQSESDLKAFAEKTRAWPIVRRAWMVSGESDFMLHCVAKDLAAFQSFVIEELTSAPNVDTVRTALTIRQVKDEGLAAIGE